MCGVFYINYQYIPYIHTRYPPTLHRYGEIVDINLVRDKDSGKSKGFAFLAYEDQRSTVLAIDNFNGITLAGRTIRVDHVRDYKQQKKKKDDRDDRDDNGGDDDNEEEQESARIILQREKAIAHSSSSSSSAVRGDKEDERRNERRNEHDDEDPMAEYFRKKAKRKHQ